MSNLSRNIHKRSKHAPDYNQTDIEIQNDSMPISELFDQDEIFREQYSFTLVPANNKAEKKIDNSIHVVSRIDEYTYDKTIPEWLERPVELENEETLKDYFPNPDDQRTLQICSDLKASHERIVSEINTLPEKNQRWIAEYAQLRADDLRFKAEGIPHFSIEERMQLRREVEDILSGKIKLPPYKNKQHGGEWGSPIEYVKTYLGKYLKPFNGKETFIFQDQIRETNEKLFLTTYGYISVDSKKTNRKYPQYSSVEDIFPTRKSHSVTGKLRKKRRTYLPNEDAAWFKAKSEGAPHFTPEERAQLKREVEDLVSGKTQLPTYKNKQHGGEYNSPFEYIERHLGRYLKRYNGKENFLFQKHLKKFNLNLYKATLLYINRDIKKIDRKYPQFSHITDIFAARNSAPTPLPDYEMLQF